MKRATAKLASFGLVATAVTAGVVLAFPALAGADAPNPMNNTGTAVVNPDGTITVTVQGEWDWQTHRSDCNLDRFGTGWNVDWNDPSQAGHEVDVLNGVMIDVGVAVANARNPFDNTVHYTPTAPYCGVYDPALGYNTGKWGPLTHTYPAGTTTINPCAVTYDIHDDKGAPKAGDLIAGGKNHNGDNSVEKNSAPAGNTCAPIAIPNSPILTLEKIVDNSKGGAAVPSNFTLSAAGPTPMSGASGAAAVTNKTVTAGTYTLSESSMAGYTADANWVCTGGTFAAPDKITLVNQTPAQNVICRITNRFAGDTDLVLTKDDNGLVQIPGGAPWDYTITVRNAGSKNLSNAATVTDVLPTPLAFVTSSIPAGCTVAGQRLTCTVPAAQLTAGAQVVITVKVSAPAGTPGGTYTNQAYVDTLEDPVCPGGAPCVPPCPPNNNNIDCEPTTVEQPPAAIGIVKKVNGSDSNTAPGVVVAAGSTMTFTYEVSNLGTSALSNVSVVDDKGVAVSCPSTTLAVGASMTCTGSAPATTVGQYTNIGTATGTPPGGGTPVTAKDPAFALIAGPKIDITKYVNGADANEPPGLSVPAGSAVTWSYRVENQGNVDLTNVTVVDDKGVAVDCGRGTGNTIALLKPAEVVTCTATGIAVLGAYTNVGTVTGQPPTGPPVTDKDNATYTGAPTAAVEPPAPVLPPGELPETGSTSGPLIGIALSLLVLGALLLVPNRRRIRTSR